MRIITPENAAFNPSGTADIGVVARYYHTQNITGDTAFGPLAIGPLPETGPYWLVIFVETTNTTAAAGLLTLNLNYNSGSVLSDAIATNLNLSSTNNLVVPISSLPVTVDWDVTGFGAGDVDIKLIASVIKLF